jgi:hypothetical protein
MESITGLNVGYTACLGFTIYGFTLKLAGSQLERKDNDKQDHSAEIYLVTASSPSVKLGVWQKGRVEVTGMATGTPRIQVWIDV